MQGADFGKTLTFPSFALIFIKQKKNKKIKLHFEREVVKVRFDFKVKVSGDNLAFG